MDKLMTSNRSGVISSRSIVNGNNELKEIVARYDNFVENGNFDVLARVFHSMPTTNAIVSYNPCKMNSERKNVIHLGSYNYSGLNGNPNIINSAIEAIKKYGTTSSGVRLLNGTTDLHLEMEKRLACFLGVEEVITFSSGLAANFAALGTLCRKGDIVLSDILNHQSIVDGLKLSEAVVHTYRHASIKSIESILKRYSLEQRKFIVTDGIFSMDGDFAPLEEIVLLANQYNAFIMVDDAHGTGHVGPNGKGTCAQFSVTDNVDIITGSLSKGLPGIGGFIATNSEVAKIIRSCANPYIFSASLPPPVLASIISAVDVLESSPYIIEELKKKTIYFSNLLRSAGLNLLNSETSIIPVLTFDENKTYLLTKLLHEKGIYVNPVSYPAVSRTRSRIRINLSFNLTYEELDYGIASIIDAAKSIGLI